MAARDRDLGRSEPVKVLRIALDNRLGPLQPPKPLLGRDLPGACRGDEQGGGRIRQLLARPIGDLVRRQQEPEQDMEWWGALLNQRRPFGVTRAGGLLVTLGAMNTLQVLVFLVTWLAPMPLSVEYRRLALTLTPIQVVYGIVRLGTGLAVLRRVGWSRRAGIVVAALEVVGGVIFAALAWDIDIGPRPEPPFSDAAFNGAVAATVAIVALIDGSVMRDLTRNRAWFLHEQGGE